MANTNNPLSTLTPAVDEFNSGTNTLNIGGTFTQATVHIDFWVDMLEGDKVELILNDDEANPLGTQFVTQTAPTDYNINPFIIPKSKLSTGDHTLKYKATIKATIPLPKPTVGFSLPLVFTVIDDADVADLKLDITTGASGFTDEHSNLLPANIAIVRGKPNTRWHAHGQGKVQIYEAFGFDNTGFTIEPDGTCPLTLIRIDHLNAGSASAATPSDALLITREGDKTTLLNKPVEFREYTDAPDSAKPKFISYSYNDIGISDGKTTSIFSIILSEATPDETIAIRMSSELSFVKKRLKVNTATRANTKIYHADVIDKTAEFGITTTTPGTYNIIISSDKGDESFSQTIEFRSLS